MIVRKHKAAYVFFTLLFATAFLFISAADTVWAEGGEKMSEGEQAHKNIELMSDESSSEEDVVASGVHNDPATFRKNMVLTPAQKEYTITEIEKTISEIIKPEMSDLEKYYTLAIWVNKHVVYDWDFWSGGYNFDYYSHQWDSYGAMKDDEKSVCVGIAIFYSNMCHAAGLPCRFVRLDPDYLDHTISYIPNISDHDYYVDITENAFFMSSDSMRSFEPYVDRAFAGIPEDGCKDRSFDYYSEYSDVDLESSNIKDFYDVPFADWYREYALHENTTKVFGDTYEEKGSGIAGTNYASYQDPDYPSDYVDVPDIWFLDDFYEDPADMKAKILDNEIDKQLLDISGLKKNYDCPVDELAAAVAQDISISYFPSAENEQVVAKSADLTQDSDYVVEFDSYDDQTRTAELTVKGIGNYKGECKISVKMNSAVLVKEPVPVRDLVYDGNPKELIEPGEAEGGEIQYAFGTNKAPTGEFSADIPTATDARRYYVWYRIVGDESHAGNEPQLIEKTVSIAPKTLKVIVEDITIRVGDTATLSPKLDVPEIPATFKLDYYDDEGVMTVDDKGVMKGIKEGTVYIWVSATLKDPSPNYAGPIEGFITVNVVSADITDADIELSKTGFTYNGKVHKPAIKTIKGLSLKAGTDYTVKWSNANSKNVGVYTVTITGKGNYTGTTKATYKINPKGTSLKTPKKARKAVTVRWKKQTAKMSKSRITGYQIQLATNRKFTKNKKTVTVKGYKKASKKVTRLKGGKKYYIRIRTYKTANGTKCYSPWSKVRTVTTKK